MKFCRTRRSVAMVSAASCLSIASVLLLGAPASAASANLYPDNVTINSGQSRTLNGAWGSNGPYNVNFQCNVTGCAGFVASSTTVTVVVRNPSLVTCSGNITRTHTLSIRENPSGNTATDSTYTRWLSGACE